MFQFCICHAQRTFFYSIQKKFFGKAYSLFLITTKTWHSKKRKNRKENFLSNSLDSLTFHTFTFRMYTHHYPSNPSLHLTSIFPYPFPHIYLSSTLSHFNNVLHLHCIHASLAHFISNLFSYITSTIKVIIAFSQSHASSFYPSPI